MRLISDFALTEPFKFNDAGQRVLHAVLVLNGDVSVLKITCAGMETSTKVVHQQTMSDIRLLNCFIVNGTEAGFDILASNGRSELLKLTYGEGTVEN